MNVPAGLLYTNDHEWIKVEGNTATIGVTDFAQSELGDIVMVEMEEVGIEISSGDSVGTLEAVKTVSDILSPVSGKLIEVNGDLETEPEIINADPYGKGWIAKIDLSDPEETQQLLSPDDYADLAE